MRSELHGEDDPGRESHAPALKPAEDDQNNTSHRTSRECSTGLRAGCTTDLRERGTDLRVWNALWRRSLLRLSPTDDSIKELDGQPEREELQNELAQFIVDTGRKQKCQGGQFLCWHTGTQSETWRTMVGRLPNVAGVITVKRLPRCKANSQGVSSRVK